MDKDEMTVKDALMVLTSAAAASERRQRYEHLQRRLRRTQLVLDLLGLLLIALAVVLAVKLLLRTFSP